MFTGIIEATGIITDSMESGPNRSYWIESPISSQLKADQSVSHNGVCLTVEEATGNRHRVTAIPETLKKTNMNDWKAGRLINLERCLRLDGRLDGHLVQGHIDTTGLCEEKSARNGGLEFTISFPKQFAELVIEKGSICVDGISLTAFDVGKKKFTIAIIPYTHEHTNLSKLDQGDTVNLEFDLVGKYILRRLSLK